jgi:hypothetical protein
MTFAKHAIFEEPDDATVIWRYMSFAKFASLLATRALYFARLDKFEDRFEGHLTKPTFELMAETLRDLYLEKRQRTIVNCWCISQHESVALWRTFIRSGEGIAIRSTFARLRDSFEPRGILAEAKVMIGKVQYVDFETHDFCNSERIAFNTFLPMLHKRRFFEFEHELRAVISPDGPIWDQVIRNTPGWRVPVDLDKLIVAIHVAPDSQPWFRETIASCAQAFSLDPGKVVQSSIDEPPPE